jgi:SAM-dependent methyltransferase
VEHLRCARKEEKMPSVVPKASKRLESLRPARGYLDQTVYVTNVVKGWLLLPDAELTSVKVCLNGTAVGFAKIQFMQDVADLYPRIRHAGRSGFQLALEPGQLEAGDVTRVRLVGCQNRRRIAQLDTLLFPKELVPAAPVPPSELIRKVQGSQDGEAYLILGYRYYRQFLEAIKRHRPLGRVRRLLDWGCGSGRVVANFLAGRDGPEIFACDIDAGAVGWCRAHFRAGQFAQSEETPPLPYADATFDVVISLAVLPAFGPQTYEAWLPEIGRVLGPDGLFLASVQGAFAASFEFAPEKVRRLLRKGIFDGGRCAKADLLHAKGQWRGYYLTPEYVQREWSKYFELLEYLEGEINADQDLLVMRRKTYLNGR